MDLSAEIVYPTMDPADAFALVVDPQFRGQVCEAMHAIDYDVAVDEHDDGSARVTVNRVMSADLPAPIKKMVGETVKIVQTEEWGVPDASGRRDADLLVEIVGQPVTMKGTIAMRQAGATVVSTIHGDLTVAVPFFGKKVEPEVAAAILAGVEREQEAASARLGG